MAAMFGVASGRVVRSFEIQVAKATNGQKNGCAEESRLNPTSTGLFYLILALAGGGGCFPPFPR